MFGDVFVFTFESMESPTFLDYYRGISDLNGAGAPHLSLLLSTQELFSVSYIKKVRML